MASYLVVKCVAVLFLLASSPSSVNSQGACTTDVYLGPDAEVALSSYNTLNANDAQFMFSNEHSITCYGEIKTWKFMTAAYLDGPCYSTNVQIWRPAPSGSGDYVLIGENALFDTMFCDSYLISDGNNTALGNTSLEVIIPSSQRIPVEPGDVIAWHDLGIDDVMRKIGYEPGLPGSSYMATVTVLQTADACSPGVGNSCPWKSTNTVGRNYGLQARVSASVKPPVFVNLPRTISISELLSVGTFVYQVVANNSYTWNPTVPPKLSYFISKESTTCDDSWFKIDQDKGNLSVANVFSLTSVAPNPNYSCNLNITVTQQDGSLSSASNLTVNVTNVNEPPKIANIPATVLYNVMNPSSLEVYNVDASDPDIPVYQGSLSLTYAIVSVEPTVSTTLFDIDSSTGVISLISALDDWTGPAQFEVNVTVTDGTYVDGPKTLTLVLENLISSPVIKNLNASVLLPEDYPTGRVFYTVTSEEDPNRYNLTNFVINYTITRQTAEAGIPCQTYDIYNYPTLPTKNQGGVYLRDRLNYSNFQNYTIDIQAIQYYNSSILRSDPRTLTVHVAWVNQPPSLSITPTTAIMPEDTPIGSTVPVTIIASDRDVEENLAGDYLQYFVSDADFVVNNETKTMLTADSLVIAADDTRCSEEHLFVVFVRDAFGQKAQTNVNVTVTRNNRQSPIFNQTQYNGTAPESGSGGSFIGVQVFAVDPDCGPNGTVTYSILEDFANEYFQIDPINGYITMKQPINQSTYPNVTFTVVAADGGLPSLSTTATVFVTVEAVNMNAPRFVNAYDEIERRSDSLVGSTIYVFTVTDPDSDSVNDIIYQPVVHQDDFDVKSDGAVSPKRNLGTFRRYTLYVVAMDTGQGQDFFTDPAILVIDTYDPKRQLIDIRMLRPLSETDPMAEEFMIEINNFLKPWVVKMEDLKYDGDDTVATIYAYEASSTFSASQSTQKSFIDRDALLDKLRTDIYGTPVDALRGPEFQDYEISSVHPSYPVWVLDTPEGIATLTIVCFVALALIIAVVVVLLKVFNLCCFKKAKVEPEPDVIEPVKSSGGQEFQLSYNTREPYVMKPEEMTITDAEPFDGGPEFRAKSPPLIRPDAEFQL